MDNYPKAPSLLYVVRFEPVSSRFYNMCLATRPKPQELVIKKSTQTVLSIYAGAGLLICVLSLFTDEDTQARPTEEVERTWVSQAACVGIIGILIGLVWALFWPWISSTGFSDSRYSTKNFLTQTVHQPRNTSMLKIVNRVHPAEGVLDFLFPEISRAENPSPFFREMEKVLMLCLDYIIRFEIAVIFLVLVLDILSFAGVICMRIVSVAALAAMLCVDTCGRFFAVLRNHIV